MSIEDAINDAIAAKMGDGTIERLVAENLEKGINKALESLFGDYGDVTILIEGKIKEVMVKQLEHYDYSKYVAKLDCVLVEILKSTSLDHKKILENFKDLMTTDEFPKIVTVSNIFEQFKEHVAREIDTSNLDVDYDDGVSYEYVKVTMEVERDEKRSWGSFRDAKLVFECEKDEELNCIIPLSQFMEHPWSMRLDMDSSIESLRYLNKFKVYLLRLKQSGAKIEIDSEWLEDEVKPEKEPEASYS
jgi:hypothetical protein